MTDVALAFSIMMRRGVGRGYRAKPPTSKGSDKGGKLGRVPDILKPLCFGFRTQHAHDALTKSGVPICDGTPMNFREWRFRTEAKMTNLRTQMAKAMMIEDDADRRRQVAFVEAKMSDYMTDLIGGLRNEPLAIAMNMGIDSIAEQDGYERLVDLIDANVHPRRSEDANLLLEEANKTNGLLSRQRGESMWSYVDRRTRFYETLQRISPEMQISDEISCQSASQAVRHFRVAAADDLDSHPEQNIIRRVRHCAQEAVFIGPHNRSASATSPTALPRTVVDERQWPRKLVRQIVGELVQCRIIVWWVSVPCSQPC